MNRQRVYSALVFIPLFYAIVQYLPPVFFSLFVATGILLAQYEFYRFHFSDQWHPAVALGLSLGLLVTVSFAFPGIMPPQAFVPLILGAILINQLVLAQDVKTSLHDSAILAFGVFYVPWFLGHLIPLRQFEHGSLLIFFLFFVTWANDTAAYYVGRGFGRHPLAPEVSPRKTWEGAIGGFLGSVAAALACHLWFLPSLSLTNTLGLGLLIGIAAPLGDLCESLLKRSAGIKDSGAVIPGHGGLLDRIDSLIFTTPTLYYYLLTVRTL